MQNEIVKIELQSALLRNVPYTIHSLYFFFQICLTNLSFPLYNRDRKIIKKTYLVGTVSASVTSSHDVILIGHAIWPKLSLINASHDEYGVLDSLCKRSERCKRARRRGDGAAEVLAAVMLSIFLLFDLSLCFTLEKNVFT